MGGREGKPFLFKVCNCLANLVGGKVPYKKQAKKEVRELDEVFMSLLWLFDSYDYVIVYL